MTPLDGIEPVLLSDKGAVVSGEGEGLLCLAASWPGQARTIWGDHARFEQTYFSTCPGYYFSGDGARRDAAGRWRITGRVDDVLNVAGHRLSTAEIEASLGSHAAVAESAVVGMPHPIKGEGIYCFVVLKAGFQGDAALEKTLKDEVRHDIGAIATPERIQFVSGLPKTRSGKIMRRILRKIVHGEEGQLGDISTLADPGVVAEILAGRKQ
jgi:acetyl-CoA synthetase